MRPKNMNVRMNSAAVALFIICLAAGAGLMAWLNQPAPLLAFAVAGLYLLFALKIADQWERVAVLRFGKFIGLRGPGLFFAVHGMRILCLQLRQR